MTLHRFAGVSFPFGAIFLLLLGNSSDSNAQTGNQKVDALQLNTITTAVPFLMISPDARHGAMGDAGAGTSPDESNSYWNAAKWANIDVESGMAISYTPWLRNLVNDMGIMYLAGHYRLSDRTTLAGSLKYFSLGQITFTNNVGAETGQFKPNEYSVSVAAGTKLSEKFSGGIAVKYINSNLTGGLNGTKRGGASTGAVDISSYYHEDIELFGRDAEIGVGLVVSNIGAKMSYTSTTSDKDFIPTNLRLGQATKLHLDDYNSLTLVTDVNKLLVPTPQPDENGNYSQPDVGVATGIFQSFSDAPRGTKEELEEISYSVGMEYWYDQLIAFRGGYFYEHPNKGNRQYFTAGFGVKLNVFGFDASYLIANRNNPLANTFRFTLSFSFEAFKTQNKESAEVD